MMGRLVLRVGGSGNLPLATLQARTLTDRRATILVAKNNKQTEQH